MNTWKCVTCVHAAISMRFWVGIMLSMYICVANICTQKLIQACITNVCSYVGYCYYTYLTPMLHFVVEISSYVCIWSLLFMALSAVMTLSTIMIFPQEAVVNIYYNDKHVVLCIYICMQILITVLV